MPTASPLAAPNSVSALPEGIWQRLFGIHECENGNGGNSFGFGRESRQSVGSKAAFPTGTITITATFFDVFREAFSVQKAKKEETENDTKTLENPLTGKTITLENGFIFFAFLTVHVFAVRAFSPKAVFGRFLFEFSFILEGKLQSIFPLKKANFLAKKLHENFSISGSFCIFVVGLRTTPRKAKTTTIRALGRSKAEQGDDNGGTSVQRHTNNH